MTRPALGAHPDGSDQGRSPVLPPSGEAVPSARSQRIRGCGAAAALDAWRGSARVSGNALRAADTNEPLYRLDRARAIAARVDHVLLELLGDYDRSLRGELALLPRTQMAPRDSGWECGGAPRLVALRRLAGGGGRGGAEAHWSASRSIAALPQLVVHHEFAIDVQATCFNGSCMIVVPTAGHSYARLVGKAGVQVARLREALGLDRLFVAREPQSAEAFARLSCAVARVSGLKRHEYAVRMNGRGALPVVIADRCAMPRLIGRGGQNLMFIRLLSGVAFTHAERPAAPRRCS